MIEKILWYLPVLENFKKFEFKDSLKFYFFVPNCIIPKIISKLKLHLDKRQMVKNILKLVLKAIKY